MSSFCVESPGRFICRVTVGRVLEARIQALATPEEAVAYSDAIRQAVEHATASAHAPDPILCADHRPVVIYAQPVADELARLFAQMNSRLHRVGIIAARSNATLSMQLGRIVREANNPRRKLLYEAHEVVEHLKPDLGEPELNRLMAFLAEGTMVASR